LIVVYVQLEGHKVSRLSDGLEHAHLQQAPPCVNWLLGSACSTSGLIIGNASSAALQHPQWCHVHVAGKSWHRSCPLLCPALLPTAQQLGCEATNAVLTEYLTGAQQTHFMGEQQHLMHLQLLSLSLSPI
jgi:hypothetical protein